MKTIRLLPLTLLALAAFLTSDAPAQIDYNWNNPGGGPYGLDTNWDPTGPPSSADHAYFTLPDSGIVDFDDDYDVYQLTIEGGSVAFDLDSHTYNIVFDGYTDNAVAIGYYDWATCYAYNGQINSGPVTLGRYEFSYGELILDSGAWWEGYMNGNWQQLIMGFDGDAYVSIANGATLRHGHGAAAARPWAWTTIEVNNQDSLYYVDGYFSLGDQGRAELFVSDRAKARIGLCVMGLHPGAHASAVISGAGSLSPESQWELASWSETSLVVARHGRADVLIENRGQLTNYGSLTVAEMPGSAGLLTITDQHSIANVYHSLAIGGDLINPGGRGTVLVKDLASLSIGRDFGDLTIWPLGRLELSYASIDCESDLGDIQDINIFGRLTGNGFLLAHVHNIEGNFSVQNGDWGSSFEIIGSYTQYPAATLEVELIDDEYGPWSTDLYVSDGDASLAGYLHVNFPDGFVPSPADEFYILYAPNGVFGQFANAINTYTCQAGTFQVSYNYDSVILYGFSPLPACTAKPASDFNHDCTVDLRDFAFFLNDWLASGLVNP